MLFLSFISTLILNLISLNFSPLSFYDANHTIGKNNDKFWLSHKTKYVSELKNLINNKQKNFDIEKTTSLVFETIRHGSRDILILENWFLWFLSNFYEPLKKNSKCEKRIVNSGVGNCNEANAVLNEIALLNNVPARFISLDGHIISRLKVKNKWIMADADYGIVFHLGIAKFLLTTLNMFKKH